VEQKEKKVMESLSKLTTLAFLVNPNSETNKRPAEIAQKA